MSPRVIDQRCRNRVIEVVELIAEGAEGVASVGDAEYVNYFFDWVDEEQHWRHNSALTQAEIDAVALVQNDLLALCAASEDLDAVQLFASGWPDRVAPTSNLVSESADHARSIQ